MSIHPPWSAESCLRRQRHRLENIFTCVTVKHGMVYVYVILVFLKTHIFVTLSISIDKDIYIIINTEDCLFAQIKKKLKHSQKHVEEMTWLRASIVIWSRNSNDWQPAEAQQICDYLWLLKYRQHERKKVFCKTILKTHQNHVLCTV